MKTDVKTLVEMHLTLYPKGHVTVCGKPTGGMSDKEVIPLFRVQQGVRYYLCKTCVLSALNLMQNARFNLLKNHNEKE